MFRREPSSGFNICLIEITVKTKATLIYLSIINHALNVLFIGKGGGGFWYNEISLFYPDGFDFLLGGFLCRGGVRYLDFCVFGCDVPF
jgi:hypothetical protein